MRRFRICATAVVAALVVAPLYAQQNATEASEEGTLIQIGPDNGVRVDVDWPEGLRDRRQERRRLRQPAQVEAPVAVARYWIGLGGESLPDAMRAQMRIDEGEGILVRNVTEDGPAAEAGVEKFDIVLRANGKPVSQLQQLADLVGEQGELKGRITLDLLRAGKPKTLWVKPVERPLDAMIPERPRRERLGLFGPEGRLRERLFNGEGLDIEQLQGLLGEGGGFDPEMFGGFAEVLPQAAMGGVSVSVSRQNGGPAKVTVRRGEKTWEFDEGDEDALNALPADVRPTVERMLNQNGRVAGDDLDAFGFGGPGFQLQFHDDMADRLRALQERMQAFGGQLGAPAAPGGVIEPQIELDEAPAFGEAPAAAPAPAPTEGEAVGEEIIELEIPDDE